MDAIVNFFKGISLQTWIIIGISVLVLILIILYVRSGRKKDTTSNTTIVNNTTVTQPSSEFPLKYGSRGESVRQWQKYLNSKGATLVEDGVWGPLTEAASTKYASTNVVTEAVFKANVK